MDAGPGWTLRRFGQSCTPLPDGREFLIAGEHEDSYDPDFFIYNDVIVRERNGEFEIFGYPTKIFPPTDFHSATLVGNQILIIGSLGYAEGRQAGTTPVFSLDLATLKFSKVSTTGHPPGWIHRHRAVLSEDCSSIVVTAGKIERDAASKALIENIDDWRLDLASMRWERLTQRDWPRWRFSRADGQMHNLWQIRSSSMMRSLGLADDFKEQQNQALESLPELIRAEIAARMRPPETTVDINMLYSPPVPHEKIPDAEDDYNIHRILVNGVTVRFAEGFSDVQLTVEGALPPEIIDKMNRHLIETLTALEQTEYLCKAIC